MIALAPQRAFWMGSGMAAWTIDGERGRNRGGFGGVEGCWLGDGRQQSTSTSPSLYLSLPLALCSLSFRTLWVLFACYSPWHCGDMAFNRLPGVKQTTSINSSVSALASAEPLIPVAPLAFSVCACMHVCTCLSVYIPERTRATVWECGCVIYFWFFSLIEKRRFW